MDNHKFEELCNDCFEKLFIEARSTNKAQFLTSFFAFYESKGIRILDYITNYVFQEVLNILNNFKILQDSKKVDNSFKTRIRMLMYCHIIEAELIYMIIFNMIRTIRGLEYSPIIYRVTSKNKIKELEYAYDKIELIKKETFSINLRFDLLYLELYNNQLRNAFSHSQYFIDIDGDLVISRYISPTTSKVFKRLSQKNHYKYEEIEDIFNKALLYVETFIEIYENFLSEFKDGRIYPCLFGNIHFDISSGKWFF